MTNQIRREPAFPAIPYPAWRDSLATVHRFAPVVGKIRLAASPRRNHCGTSRSI